jgi:DNA-directed RNA polymerase subunit RPC12/RpoP
MKCNVCGKEFDPGDDFLCDSDNCEALSLITGGQSESTCGDCSYKLLDALKEKITSFYQKLGV